MMLTFYQAHAISSEDPEFQAVAALFYVGDNPAGLQLPGKAIMSSNLTMDAVRNGNICVHTLLNMASGLVR
jgi:hypothetical protein